MHYLVDDNKKIIFCWSFKSGCSHIKYIFWYLKNNAIENNIHTPKSRMELPKDMHKYTTIIFSRNPYKRIVSGFLQKYLKNGEFRHLWKHDIITFSMFVDELIRFIPGWNIMIDENHFIPQTAGEFDQHKLNKSKKLVFFDIESINYNYIGSLFETTIPEDVINHKFGHERTKTDKTYKHKVYNLDMDLYYNYNISLDCFYNKEIRDKVYSFYKRDFEYFKENGLDYHSIMNKYPDLKGDVCEKGRPNFTNLINTKNENDKPGHLKIKPTTKYLDLKIDNYTIISNFIPNGNIFDMSKKNIKTKKKMFEYSNYRNTLLPNPRK